MGKLEWMHQERIGWADVDQDGHLKFSSMFRFVAAGYAGMFPLLTEDSRAEYFATHELQPIVRHLEMAREPHGAKLDAGLSLHFTVRLGFTRDSRSESRRYGGHDAIQLIGEHGEALGGWTQYWLWFVPKVGTLVHEPAPGLSVEQSEELPFTEAPPPVSPGAEVVRFRWTPRETDANHHVTAYAYLERAESALADANLDARGLHRAGMWFRRPSLLGDLMTSSYEELDDDTLLVALTREEPHELCVTVRFRGS
jgi:acyl-CoA thioesterase FadM